MTGDMNNDGKIDIIGTNIHSIYINILYNTGNGTFYDKLLIETSSRVDDISVGYINEDDRLDIIIVVRFENIMILYNMGNQQFINQTYQFGRAPVRVKVIDVNNDKKLDLIIIYNSRNFSIVLNHGNGIFSDPIIYLTEYRVLDIIPMDINNDQKVDFIVDIVHIYNLYYVLLNKGNEIFSDPYIYSSQIQQTSISIGDINNDQKLDLIIDYFHDKKIAVRFNMGNGTFTNESIYSVSFEPAEAVAMDINGDGYMEIIYIGQTYTDAYVNILWIYC